MEISNNLILVFSLETYMVYFTLKKSKIILANYS